MKRSTLELLRCPGCHSALLLRHEISDGTVDDGELSCSHCDRNYLIKDGIARFVSGPEVEGLNRRFVRFYDRYSRFDTICSKLSFLPMGGERRARAEILRRLELNGGRLLEVSIGTGGNLPFLFESSEIGEVYGLDISEAQLTRCRNLVNARGWPVDLFLGMAEELPFEADSFDNVLHVGGINFFSDKKKALEEMIRVARPGSKIVIADESERVAQFIARLLRLSRFNQGKTVDTSVPVHLVPETMKDVRTDGLWKRHGRHHGYCLEFRKPPL